MGNSEGSPLRILFRLRQDYIDAYNDRYFVTPHDELPSWFLLFTYLEIAYQLPMVFWMLRVFEDHTKGTTPGFELACVIYGVEVALTTLTCVFDVPYWDRAVYTTSEKANFMFLIYGPWVLIRTFGRVFFGVDGCRKLTESSEHSCLRHGPPAFGSGQGGGSDKGHQDEEERLSICHLASSSGGGTILCSSHTLHAGGRESDPTHVTRDRKKKTHEAPRTYRHTATKKKKSVCPRRPSRQYCNITS